MPALSVIDLAKTFGSGPRAAAALRGVSLDVEAGELLVLLGPSGCGKSTVLRCVAGLEQPSGGRILLDGSDITGSAPRDRDVAMVFQSYALYPHMTVWENIAFPLVMRGMPQPEIKRRVDDVSVALGLGALWDRRPAQLSGGERQRVALGRAIIREPKVFLFDEPLSNLDAKLRAAMRAELLALHRKLGATIVFVTHDQVEAMTMGRRIAVLDKGMLQQVGTPQQIYANPANAFVAQFIGSPGMNLLPQPDGGTVGFRPEDARLGPVEGARFRGRVRLVEPLGAETLVHVALFGNATVVVRLRGIEAPEHDTETGVHVAAAGMYRFDAEGARLT